MTSVVEDQLDSSSIWNLVYFYCNQFYFTVSDLSLIPNFNITRVIRLFNDEGSDFTLLFYLRYLLALLPYDEFQFELLKVFLAIILANTILLIVAWKVYGKQVCQRFMKPATPKVIEELKKSVSELKLPKQYSPRI